jgi:ATP-dependent phosphofructokinase / diphosphate-dependent phosphofructokinase
VVVAEGAELPGAAEGTGIAGLDAFGFERLGGIAYALAPELERLTGFEARVTVLGHLQRGGTPTAFDRVLATRFGVAAADLAAERHFGTMVALRGGEIVDVPLVDACVEVRGVPPALIDVAATFYG